jgi:hypothetical protein
MRQGNMMEAIMLPRDTRDVSLKVAAFQAPGPLSCEARATPGPCMPPNHDA